jgi:glyoxylase-like metal-dependent hydrolase (beta-lactamase superfamily II)
MIFRQLSEPESCTYTYLIGCRESGLAALVDPALETVERDLDVLKSLGLALAYTVETHIHADHVTSAARLRALTGCRIAFPEVDRPTDADLGLREGEALAVGTVEVRPLFTPGHTAGHHSYLIDTGETIRVLTGDALLIDGCGRTDFQGGCPVALYRSVTEKIFALRDETLVYPGHDYNNRRVSTVAQERDRNPRLGGGKSVEEFVGIMAGLNLPPPKKLHEAVPANLRCGAPA